MAKTVKTVKPVKPVTLPDNASLMAMCAASWRGLKGAPPEGKCRVVSYDASGLYDNGYLVAMPVRKGKARFILATGHGQRYGSWGRKSQSLADMLKNAITNANGPVITATDHGGTTANLVGNAARTGSWASVVQTVMQRDVAGGLYIAKVMRVPAKAWQKTFKPPTVISSYHSGREITETRCREERAEKLAYDLSPEGKKAIIAARKEAERQRAIMQAKREALNPYERVVYDTRRVLDGLLDGAITSDMILRYLGHEPQAGEYYKRLHDGARANHGGFTYPLDGSWTEELTDVQLCTRGYHVTTAEHLARWKDWGPYIYLIEGKGECHNSSDKTAFGSIRLAKYIGTWTDTPEERSALLAARDATHAVKIAEAQAAYDTARHQYTMAMDGGI